MNHPRKQVVKSMAKENNIWRYTFNTDTFSKEIQDEIASIWKKDKKARIAIRGSAKKEFQEWLKANYPDVYEDNNYYMLEEVKEE